MFGLTMNVCCVDERKQDRASATAWHLFTRCFVAKTRRKTYLLSMRNVCRVCTMYY